MIKTSSFYTLLLLLVVLYVHHTVQSIKYEGQITNLRIMLSRCHPAYPRVVPSK